MYVTLEQLKQHCIIDKDFTDDDLLLLDYLTVAEDAVSRHLDIDLADLENSDGRLPAAIVQAILLLAANLYANREPVSYSNAVTVPYTFEYLVGKYKKYYLP